MADTPPDAPRYKFPAEVRQKLEGSFDVDALEEILAKTAPEHREGILGGSLETREGADPALALASPENLSPDHEIPPGAVYDPRAVSGRSSVQLPVYSDDPEMQALIERLWAPYLDLQPDEVLDRGGLPIPGVEAARARRAAARSHQSGGDEE